MTVDPRWPITRFGVDLGRALPNFIQNVTGYRTATPGLTERPFADDILPGYPLISCTAVYSINSGIVTYTLTPSVLPGSALIDGMRFRFIPPTGSSLGGLVSIAVTGMTPNPVTLMRPDGFSWARFEDVQKDMPFEVEYVGVTGLFHIVSTPVSWTQASIKHGSVVIAAVPKGDAGGPRIDLGVYDGGGLLIQNPLTGMFRLCTTFGISTHLKTDTAYVNGVPNSSLDDNSWYNIYAFNPNGNDTTSIALDFCTVGFNLNTLGIFTKFDDQSRTFLGFVYTLNGDPGFGGSGNKPQILLRSWFNTCLLGVQNTGLITRSGVSSTYVSIPNAQINMLLDAANHIPLFQTIAEYTNDTAGAIGYMYLDIDGFTVETDGSTSPFAFTTKPMRVTCSNIGDFNTLIAQMMQALPTGFFAVTPMVKNDTGTGIFKANSISPAWQ